MNEQQAKELQQEYKDRKDQIPAAYVSDNGNTVEYSNVDAYTAYQYIITSLGRFRSNGASRFTEEQLLAHLRTLVLTTTSVTRKILYEETIKRISELNTSD